MKKYNLSNIMKRAWALVKEIGMTISCGLKLAWREAKEVEEEVKNAVVSHFMYYNRRRYSRPWVCQINNGKYDFSKEVGCFTGEDGDEGDLVVFEPVAGQVYAFGQKDYRGGNTEKSFCKWNGSEFQACDILGR